MDLGNFIKTSRLTQCLTQEELANKCKVNRVQVWKWETNQAKPSLENVKALSKALSCEPKEIIEKMERR